MRLKVRFSGKAGLASMLRSFHAYKMCALLLAAPCWAVPVFQVQAIGPAGMTSSARAINGVGAVVGNSVLPDGTYQAFLWQNGQFTALSMPAGAAQSWATAINGSGQIGGYVDSVLGPVGTLWDASGNVIRQTGNYIRGLNAAGDVAGMAIDASGAGYAFVTRDGLLSLLGQPAGGDWSSANAISSLGMVAGSAMNASGSFRAFRAAADGSVELLNGLGGANSYGQAINSAGAVAGHSQTGTGALNATIWAGSQTRNLGTLGGANSYAFGINAGGQVVGYSDMAGSGNSAAFLYSDGLLYDLNGLLGPSSEWQLLAAYGLNDAGQIVGRGIYKGQERAFLLTPMPYPQGSFASAPPDTGVPEPSTFWLIGAPVLAFFAIRARHR